MHINRTLFEIIHNVLPARTQPNVKTITANTVTLDGKPFFKTTTEKSII
jgi:hypothetical protein